MKWRQPEPCDNCPFNTSGPGRQLRRSLSTERWEEIIDGIRNDEAFFCHKTTPETGDGTNLVCAGALNWQHRHGVSSNFERVMGRLEYIAARDLGAAHGATVAASTRAGVATTDNVSPGSAADAASAAASPSGLSAIASGRS